MRIALSPHEVLAEFRRQTRLPAQPQLDALLRRGISRWAIAGAPGSGEHSLAFTRIELDGHTFAFAQAADPDTPPPGQPALAVLALNAWAEPVDIVAWPLRGAGLASWLGTALLGAQHVHGSRLDEALAVFPDPWAWLAGDRLGVVLVDPARAARGLQDAGPFRAANVAHGLRLQRLLTPPMPAIVVRELEGVAA